MYRRVRFNANSLLLFFQPDEEAGYLALSHTLQLQGARCTHEGAATPVPTVQAGGLVKFGLLGLHVLIDLSWMVCARAT
jgi:hypothetical protein